MFCTRRRKAVPFRHRSFFRAGVGTDGNPQNPRRRGPSVQVVGFSAREHFQRMDSGFPHLDESSVMGHRTMTPRICRGLFDPATLSEVIDPDCALDLGPSFARPRGSHCRATRSNFCLDRIVSLLVGWGSLDLACERELGTLFRRLLAFLRSMLFFATQFGRYRVYCYLVLRYRLLTIFLNPPIHWAIGQQHNDEVLHKLYVKMSILEV